MTIERSAVLIIANIKSMGLSINRKKDGARGAAYLEVPTVTKKDSGGSEISSINIRIAVTPAVNSDPDGVDFDVSAGTKYRGADTIHWFDVIFYLADKLGVKATTGARISRGRHEKALKRVAPTVIIESEENIIAKKRKTKAATSIQYKAHLLKCIKRGGLFKSMAEWLFIAELELRTMPKNQARYDLVQRINKKKYDLDLLVSEKDSQLAAAAG